MIKRSSPLSRRMPKSSAELISQLANDTGTRFSVIVNKLCYEHAITHRVNAPVARKHRLDLYSHLTYYNFDSKGNVKEA
jgi:hypothetical protein